MNGPSVSNPSALARLPTERALSWVSVIGIELRLWVATCVTALSTFCASALGVLPHEGGSPEALGVVFSATLALYNLDASLDAKSRELSQQARRAHIALTCVSLAIVAWCASGMSLSAKLLTAAGIVACSLYAVPLPGRGVGQTRHRLPAHAHRLKAIPHLKAPFVGGAVSVAVVWVPVLGGNRPVDPSTGILITGVLALYCTANAILFDVPDTSEDENERTPTIASNQGIEAAKSVSRRLCQTGLGLLALSSFFDTVDLSMTHALGLFGLGIYLVVAARRISDDSSRNGIAWLVDGGLLLPLVIVALAGAL